MSRDKNVVFPVHFDFHSPAELERAPTVDPFQTMRLILARGFRYLQFMGLPETVAPIAQRNEFSGHVPVEEDADFMLQHYEDIESVFAADSYRDLYLFLGDGVLELNTRFTNSQAIIDLISRPGLSRHHMKQETLNVSRQNFLMAWRRVARDLIAAAHP